MTGFEIPSEAVNYTKYGDNSKNDNEIWNAEKLKDKLYVHLMSIKIHGERKYERQAIDLIYRIPVYRPYPYFIINYRDLSPRLIKELSGLDYTNPDIVIKDVLSWIYESIDKEYFLLSVKRHGLIFWRIDP